MGVEPFLLSVLAARRAGQRERLVTEGSLARGAAWRHPRIKRHADRRLQAYEALDAAGRPSSGLLEADNAKGRARPAARAAVVPLEVNPVGASAAPSAGIACFARKVFGSTALTVWTPAGRPGRRPACRSSARSPPLAEEAETTRQRELVAHLRARSTPARSFARALASAPREFDEVVLRRGRRRASRAALGTVLDAPGRRPRRAPGAARQA